MAGSRMRNILGDSGKPVAYEAGRTPGAMTGQEPLSAEMCRMLCWSLEGFQKEAVLTSGRTARTWRLASDEGAHLAGHDAAPPPLGFLSVGLAQAYSEEFKALAKLRSVTLGDVSVRIDNFFRSMGSIAEKTFTGNLLPFDVTFEVQTEADQERLLRLARDAVHVARISGLFSRVAPGLFHVELNNAPVQIPGFRTFDPRLSDIERFTVSEPFDIGPNTLIDRSGDAEPSPKSDVVHVSATLNELEPGLNVSRQELRSPRGSGWDIVSSDCLDTRAPDASTLVSSAMGFCFMTKLQMLSRKYDVPIERVTLLQHTEFGPGGASDGTGEAPDFQPPKTYLKLESTASAGSAAELVQLAQRACYVHRVCEITVKPRVRVFPSDRLTVNR